MRLGYLSNAAFKLNAGRPVKSSCPVGVVDKGLGHFRASVSHGYLSHITIKGKFYLKDASAGSHRLHVAKVAMLI